MKYKLPESDNFFRDYNLDKDGLYTIDSIKSRINNRVEFIERRKQERAEQKANMSHVEKISDKHTIKTKEMLDLSATEKTQDNIGLRKWQEQQNTNRFFKILSDTKEKYSSWAMQNKTLRKRKKKSDIPLS